MNRTRAPLGIPTGHSLAKAFSSDWSLGWFLNVFSFVVINLVSTVYPSVSQTLTQMSGVVADVINVYHQWTPKKQEVIVHDARGADPVSRGLQERKGCAFPGFQPALGTWDSQALQLVSWSLKRNLSLLVLHPWRAQTTQSSNTWWTDLECRGPMKQGAR